jgi:Flp pilus assembly protein TadB
MLDKGGNDLRVTLGRGICSHVYANISKRNLQYTHLCSRRGFFIKNLFQNLMIFWGVSVFLWFLAVFVATPSMFRARVLVGVPLGSRLARFLRPHRGAGI